MAEPAIGERRTFDGQLGEWDGKAWRAVSSEPTSAPRTEPTSDKPTLVRSRTGQMYTPPTDSGASDFASGVASNFDPRNIANLAKNAWDDPVGTAGNVAMSVPRMLGRLVTNPATALGQLTGMAATGPLMEGAGAVGKAAAPGIYEAGLGRTAAMRRSFPTAATEGVSQGIVNPNQANVAAKLSTVEGQLRGAANDTDAAISGTTAGPALRIDPQTIADEAKALVIKRAGLVSPNAAGGSAARANRSGAIQQVNKLADQFVKENQDPLSSLGTLSLKRGQQDLANSAYLKAERGAPVNDIKTLWDEATAEVARKQFVGQVPSAEGSLNQQQGLLGLQQAAKRRINQPIVPTSSVAAVKQYLLEHPAVMGRLGVGADRLGVALQNPRFVQSVQSMMGASTAATPEPAPPPEP